jgi:peptide/nickel transport system substrate-binding protein
MKIKMIWSFVYCLTVIALMLPSQPLAKEPQYGGTLTVISHYADREPTGWDPALATYAVDFYVTPYMDKVVVADFEKGPRGTKEYGFNCQLCTPTEFLKGSLAERWETPDPLTAVFYIRKGIMYPDKPGVMKSREATAEDVAFSLTRYTKAPRAGSRVKFVDSITATDRYTVTLKFNKYNANWMMDIIGGKATPIYPPELVKAGITNWKNAVGSGPWMLEKYVSGTSVTYKKNPLYSRKTKINGKVYKLPFADKLELLLIKDEATRIAALRTGKADINANVGWKYRKSLERTNRDLQRWEYYGGAQEIFMRTDRKPFTDIRVRQALNLAIDKGAILDVIYGGEGILHNRLIGAQLGDSYFTPLEKLPPKAKMLYQYDPERAKQLLADAGYPKGFKTELVTTNFAVDLDIAAMAKGYWQKIGVDATLRPLEYGTTYGMLRKHGQKQMIMLAGSFCDPIKVMRMQCVLGESWNASMIDDPVALKKYEEMAATTDAVARAKLIKALNVYLTEQAYHVFMPGPKIYHYAWPWVKNYYGELDESYATLANIWGSAWIDQDVKKKMGK